MRRKGHTLIETLVFMFLMSLAFTAIYAVLIGGLHLFQTANATSDLENVCIQTSTGLARDLAESNSSTVQISAASPAGISFASPRDQTGAVLIQGGAMQWRKFICYYVDGSGNMIRKEQSIADTSSVPVGQLAANTPAVFQGLNGPRHQLGANVTQFVLSMNAAAIPPSVSFTIVADQRDAAGTIIKDVHGNPLNEVSIVPPAGSASVILQN